MIVDIHAHYLPQGLYQRFDAEAAEFPDGEARRVSILVGIALRVIRICADFWCRS